MEIKLYESYGVLAHEYEPVYTEQAPLTNAYNVVTVEIPDEYPISESITNETLIDIDGETYLLLQVLSNVKDAPALQWYDGQREHFRRLNVIRREER